MVVIEPLPSFEPHRVAMKDSGFATIEKNIEVSEMSYVDWSLLTRNWWAPNPRHWLAETQPGLLRDRPKDVRKGHSPVALQKERLKRCVAGLNRVVGLTGLLVAGDQDRAIWALVDELCSALGVDSRVPERLANAAVNNFPTAAWCTRPDGHVEFVNHRWLDYTGLSTAEARGWGWQAAIHPDDLNGLVGHWQACLASGGAVETEARMRRFDGAYRWFLLRASPLRDERGTIVRWYGTSIDIEDRRRAEQALLELRAEHAHMSRISTLGVLTASVIHEVNQPLSGIVTNANTCLRMLSANPPNIAGALETARRTLRDGNRATEVVLRLATLFAKGPAKNEEIDLSEAATEVVALVSSDLQRNRVRLRLELACDLPRLTADRVQLQQVILNLLLNASDAMSRVDDHQRVAVITTASDGPSVKLSVRDAGVGFATGDAERLFQAFYTTKSSGMGIGLTVSRSIVDNHGGRLWGEVNDGPGATFSFAIPVPSTAIERSARD